MTKQELQQYEYNEVTVYVKDMGLNGSYIGIIKMNRSNEQTVLVGDEEIFVEGITKVVPLNNYHYRLYSADGIFLRECHTFSAGSAEKLLKAATGDTIFNVEDDGHEVKCGIDWIEDMLDNPEESLDK